MLQYGLPQGCRTGLAAADPAVKSSSMHDTAGLGIPDEQWLGATAQPSAYKNTLLRQVYSQGADIAATDIVAFFKAGQVNPSLHSSYSFPRFAF